MSIDSPGTRELRRELNKQFSEYVIKDTFNSLYNNLFIKTTFKHLLSNQIEERVIEGSKGAHRLSLAYNLILKEYFDSQTIHEEYFISNEKTLPDLLNSTFARQIMLGPKGKTKLLPFVESFLERTVEILPQYPKNFEGDDNTYTDIAEQYITSIKNYIQTTFDRKQLNFIKIWLTKNNIDLSYISVVKNLVRYNKCTYKKYEPLDLITSFVNEQRNILKLDLKDFISDEWIPKHFNVVIQYFEYMKNYVLLNEGKFTNNLPENKIKRHHIHIDTNVYFYIFKKLFFEIISEKINQNEKNKKKHITLLSHDLYLRLTDDIILLFDNKFDRRFLKSLDLKRINDLKINLEPKDEKEKDIRKRNKNTETKDLVTFEEIEYIKNCDLKLQQIQIQRTKEQEYLWFILFDINKFITKNQTFKGFYFTRTIETDGFAVSIHFRRPKFEIKVLTDKEKLDLDLIDRQKSDSKVYRIICSDNGRVNLIYAVEEINGKFVEYVLKRNQYYEYSGIIEYKHKTIKWSKETVIKEINDKLSKCKKFSSIQDYYEYLKLIKENYDILWTTYTDRKYSKGRFNVFSGKQRTLHSFYSKIRDSQENKNIKFIAGNGSFSSTGKGEKAAPVTKVMKIASLYFKIFKIDEFRTSQIDYETEEQLHKVAIKTTSTQIIKEYLKKKKDLSEMKEKEIDATRSVRGLYCHCSDNGSKLVNRDLNAAKNIYKLYIHYPYRPPILCRGNEILPKLNLFYINNER